ncbi:MAG: hypothetical protein OXM57_12575 [bacterium]|nr:hypothetical protein [bacterium]MDE0353516.1 hypothetical protein [bacterium]
MTPRACLRRLLLASGLALLLPGCGLREPPATQQSTLAPSTRATVVDLIEVPCEDTITEFSPPGPDLNTVDPDFDIIGGVAALRTSKTSGQRAQGTAHGFYDDPTLRLASKTPLLVRRGATFELRVPDRFNDRVALDYGRSGPSLRAAFGPCESETEWLLFTGYVWVADPECITLEVVLPDATVEARELGLGAPCRGES